MAGRVSLRTVLLAAAAVLFGAGLITFAVVTPERLQQGTTAAGQVLVWLFVVSLLVLLVRWMLRTDGGITVLPFVGAQGDGEARRLAAGLAAELEQIRSVYSATDVDIPDIRLTGTPRPGGQRDNNVTLPAFGWEKEPFEQVVANVGAVEIAGVRLSVSEMLVSLRRLSPRQDRTTFLLPAVEQSGPSPCLWARLQGQERGPASSWQVAITTPDTTTSESTGIATTVPMVAEPATSGTPVGREALAHLALEIAKDLAPGIGIRTASTFRCFIEALRCMQRYSFRRSPDDLTRARELRDAALAEEPNCEDLGRLSYTLGIAYLNHGESGQAERMFKDATDLCVDEKPWLGLGVARTELGQLDLAEKAYLTALVLEPASEHALNNLAELHRIRGRLSDAIAVCGKALEVAPRFVYARLTMGNLYAARADRRARRGRPRSACAGMKEAVAQYEEAMRIAEEASGKQRNLRSYPEYAYACNGLANVLVKQHSFEKAIELHRKAITVNPKDAFFWHSLGNSRLRQANLESHAPRRKERYREAVDALENARSLSPGYEWTLFHLAEAYSVLGDDRARDTFREAVDAHRTQGDRRDRRLEPPARVADDWRGSRDRDGGAQIAGNLVKEGGNPDLWRYLGYAHHFLGCAADAFDSFAVARLQVEDDLTPRPTPERGTDQRSKEEREVDLLGLHVVRGVDQWTKPDDVAARREMRSALDGFERTGPRQTWPADWARRCMLWAAVAHLVLGDHREAVQLARQVLPAERPLPFQASTLWLCLLLHEGPPLPGLEELEHLLGYPELVAATAR